MLLIFEKIIKQENLSLYIMAVFFYALFYFIFLKNNPCAFMYDSGHYHAGALGFLTQGAYLDTSGDPLFYRLPGYPLFLAVVYKMVGVHLHAIVFFQIFIAALLPVLTRSLAIMLGLPKRVAFLSGVLAIVAPAYLIFSGLVMSEVFSGIFLLATLYFLLHSLQNREDNNFKTIGVAGLCLGVASLVRPVGHLLIPCVIVFLAIFLHRSWRKKIVAFFYFVAAWMLVVGPWLLRNFLLTGYLFFHTLPGNHFINHVAVRVAAAAENIPYEAAKKNIVTTLDQKFKKLELTRGKPLLEIERVLLSEQETIALVLKHPGIFFRLASVNMLKTACGLYSSELLMIDACGALPAYDGSSVSGTLKKYLVPGVQHQRVVFFIYYEILFLFFALCGAAYFLCFYWRKLLDPLNLFCALWILFFIGISFACGYARLRFAAEIFYIFAAAFSLDIILSQISGYRG